MLKTVIVNHLLDRVFNHSSLRQRRRVVYTCMFGYSEKFADRAYESAEPTDFICFTDDPRLKAKNWRLVFVDSRKLGPTKTSKMVKILAHKFVRQYESSLYLDNTVQLKSTVDTVFAQLVGGKMMCFRHPWWNCIYTEAEKLVELGYDNPEVLFMQTEAYQRVGYPPNAGLIAGTMLLRRHNDRQVAQVMAAWFSEVLQHSYRDQMSFNYAAWKHAFEPRYFEGALDQNEFMVWPVVTGHRLPRGFRDKDYLELNPDVAKSKINPRKHYVLFGAEEGRRWRREAAQSDV